jgi:hypothetical protein
MRHALKVILIVLSLHSPLSSASEFFVDQAQSYVSVLAPSWERGLALSLTDLNGNVLDAGYVWTLTLHEKQFQLGGSLKLADSPNTRNGSTLTFLVDTQNLFSLAPMAVKIPMPSYLDYTSSTGTLANCGCIGVTYASDYWARGTFLGDTITLDGGKNAWFIPTPNQFWLGGTEPPPFPSDYSYVDAATSFHIVASVPEPSSGLMLLVGLVPILSLRKSFAG